LFRARTCPAATPSVGLEAAHPLSPSAQAPRPPSHTDNPEKKATTSPQIDAQPVAPPIPETTRRHHANVWSSSSASERSRSLLRNSGSAASSRNHHQQQPRGRGHLRVDAPATCGCRERIEQGQQHSTSAAPAAVLRARRQRAPPFRRGIGVGVGRPLASSGNTTTIITPPQIRPRRRPATRPSRQPARRAARFRAQARLAHRTFAWSRQSRRRRSGQGTVSRGQAARRADEGAVGPFGEVRGRVPTAALPLDC